MSRRIPAFIFLGACVALSILSARSQEPEPDVRMVGTVSTKPLLTAVVRAVKQDKGLRVAISADLTSLDAVDAVAQGKAGIAIITKTLTGIDRSQYPEVNLVSIPIGMEVVALGISNDLWDSGLHSVTKDVMRQIYERKITNWQEAGGPDEKVTLFNLPQGQGTWEIFAEWLYKDNRKAPLPKVQYLASSEDARDALEFTPGAITPMAAVLVDGTRCHALGVEVSGHIAEATPKDVAAKSYPIVRPLLLVVAGEPVLANRAVTEFLTGPAGQALVKKYGAFGLDAVPPPPPSDFSAPSPGPRKFSF